jgi:choline kinase
MQTVHAMQAQVDAPPQSASRQCIVLGAGKPHSGQTPTLLHEPVSGVRVIDWLLDALGVSAEEATLIVGYQAEVIRKRFTDLHLVQNSAWEKTGSGMSLLEAKLDPDRPAFVCYGDVLFRAEIVDALERLDAPVAVAWDSAWQHRYAHRSAEDLQRCEKVVVTPEGAVTRLGADLPNDWATGEFVGLVRFSAEAVARLTELQTRLPESLRQCHLSGLIEWLRNTGMTVGAVDVAGDWAEVNAPADIAHFVLGTKAETLRRLRGLISTARIQDQIAFTVADWQHDANGLLAAVQERFAGKRLVVRSSARSEDSFTASKAGAYTSLLDIDPQRDLAEAVSTVIASYGAPCPEDQVLVQPMVTDVAISGVAFTRTLDRGAPYYVVNYDESGATDRITDGSCRDSRTLVVRRGARAGAVADPRLARLVAALQEIEELVGFDALDVEFAIDRQGHTHVFQVRPITVQPAAGRQADADCTAALDAARQVWRRLQAPEPHLPGGRAVYGVMPDWNPAEIIGTSPGRLAESLYRFLIMDDVWATQRAEYGYRDVRPHPLLVNFAGRPYVDVRASFASFIPAAVPDDLAGRLAAFYLDWLCAHPHLHDKVEFEVVPTCLGFDFERWRRRLSQAGFAPDEIETLRRGLHGVTARGMTRTEGDLEAVRLLARRFEKFTPAKGSSSLERARVWLDDCKRLGTLPFAHLARSGFVAVTLLREAVAAGILSEAAKESFFSTVRTVSHELVDDACAVAAGRLAWESFVTRYGHLRPGTYDISSPCYAQDPERYLRPLVAQADEASLHAPQPAAWEAEKKNFFDALRQLALPAEPANVERFLRQAIEGREWAKFIFTRNLSAGLEAMAHYGEALGLSREELANVPLEEIMLPKDRFVDPAAHQTFLKEAAEQGLRKRELAMACELPPLLTAESDFDSFVLRAGAPNFIGSARVTAACRELRRGEESDIAGCIVLIAHADPGYDWVFGQGIAGLITMYGGANSHMAIRAAEFGLPAAIGVGEQLYRKLAQASLLELDSANATLRILR